MMNAMQRHAAVTTQCDCPTCHDKPTRLSTHKYIWPWSSAIVLPRAAFAVFGQAWRARLHQYTQAHNLSKTTLEQNMIARTEERGNCGDSERGGVGGRRGEVGVSIAGDISSVPEMLMAGGPVTVCTLVIVLTTTVAVTLLFVS